MDFIKSFRNDLMFLSSENFDDFAVEAFHFQYKENKIYRKYVNSLGLNVDKVNSIYRIPFLPISFFKTHQVISGEFEPEKIFLSSGTTMQSRSQHSMDDTSYYKQLSLEIFTDFYGDITDFAIIAILPSYLEQGNSSLIAMVDYFIKKSENSFSGYYLNNSKTLEKTIADLKDGGKTILLIGVTYALLDLAENRIDMHKCIVMETGGMKGRKKELVREELHEQLCKGLNISEVHSEYGMTEMTSQGYSHGEGEFHTGKTLKVLIRDINDPFSYVRVGKSGGINVIDLGNIHSCCFLETKDIGKTNSNGSFEILGRFDNSDIRGCNLLLV